MKRACTRVQAMCASNINVHEIWVIWNLSFSKVSSRWNVHGERSADCLKVCVCVECVMIWETHITHFCNGDWSHFIYTPTYSNEWRLRLDVGAGFLNVCVCVMLNVLGNSHYALHIQGTLTFVMRNSQSHVSSEAARYNIWKLQDMLFVYEAERYTTYKTLTFINVILTVVDCECQKKHFIYIYVYAYIRLCFSCRRLCFVDNWRSEKHVIHMYVYVYVYIHMKSHVSLEAEGPKNCFWTCRCTCM